MKIRDSVLAPGRAWERMPQGSPLSWGRLHHSPRAGGQAACLGLRLAWCVEQCICVKSSSALVVLRFHSLPLGCRHTMDTQYEYSLSGRLKRKWGWGLRGSSQELRNVSDHLSSKMELVADSTRFPLISFHFIMVLLLFS